MSVSEDNSINSMNLKINNQELRICQQDVHEMREQYQIARKREAEASQMLSIERVRCKTQEAEIDRRRKQLEESNEFIKRLQAELEDARRTASGVQWELRENEIKSMRDAEIIHYKAQITGLEAKLKRKQCDLDSARELIKERHKSMERELTALKAELAKKVASDRTNVLDNTEFNDKMDQLNQRIGSLTAINETLQDKINGMQAEKFELENKLRYCEEDKCSLKREIDSLKDQLTDTEGSGQRTTSYLSNEIDKVKEQKAQLRWEHVQLKKKFARLEVENKALNEQIESSKNVGMEHRIKLEALQREKEDISSENTDLRNQLAAMKDTLTEHQKKVEEAERLLKENEVGEEARMRQLKMELENSQKKMDSMRKALIELDSQCDRMLCKLKTVDQEKKSALQENRLLQRELEQLRKNLESECKVKNEVASAREENDRLVQKIKYLENELNESRIEHRNELARLAEKVSKTEAKVVEPKDSPTATQIYTVGELQSLLKQKESQCRYLERNSEQTKKELDSINKEVADMRKRECDLINDNTILRQALAEAVKKGEQYRDENAELKKCKETFSSESQSCEKRVQELEDEVYEMRAELEQKEKLIGYLQSIQEPKKMQKPKRNRSSFSTLISASNDSTSASDIELEAQQCEELEKERDRLRVDLERQRKVLSEKQNESVPLLKNTKKIEFSSSEEIKFSSPRGTTKTIEVTSKLQRELCLLSLAKPVTQSPRVGTMRHDIHHVWKNQFITITSAQCGVCFEGVPHVGNVKKCIRCSLIVHTRCMPNIMNTCGLPSGYADYYLGAHSTTIGAMNGWVKLWCSSDRAGNKWRNAWAVIENNRLNFYDSDHFAMNDSPPFRTINLDSDEWRIFNQNSELPSNIGVLSSESASRLIEIKLESSSLFMLAATPQAKQRWVKSLQLATNRRVQRRSSTTTGSSIFEPLLCLKSPQNLTIHCTQILDDDWLLIGCEEGLFATSLHNDPPRTPFRITDAKSIYCMELMSEQNMLLVICDKRRMPAAIHIEQLRRALRTEESAVQYTLISSTITDCHKAVVSKPEHSHKRYVYLATTNAIHVLQFVEKLDVFSEVTKIKTAEPCICICSTPIGFLYGSDQFHLATFESNFKSLQLTIDNCPSDFPISAVEITSNEYLLAYTNYGVFVTSDGKRTRRENVEWPRLPLELVYTAPYLYIVCCDFLEIVRVATYEGENSPGLTDDRSMFKCRSAHQTGRGVGPSDVIFSVSTSDVVELHVFHTDREIGKSILKRKLVDSLTRPATKRKY